MADKLKIEDLKGIFRDNDNIRLYQDSGGPETGAESYNKYGVYCDTAGRTEFLCVIMERDDPAANPDGPWTEDDYIPHSAARFDFASRTWKTERGNMNLVSSQSFSFMDDENQFFDQLQGHIDRLNPEATPLPASGERFDESQP